MPLRQRGLAFTAAIVTVTDSVRIAGDHPRQWTLTPHTDHSLAAPCTGMDK
jgi:hypothetical protein